MGFPRQEYWNGLPFPSPGDLPNPGNEPLSPVLAGGFFTTEPPGKLNNKIIYHLPTRRIYPGGTVIKNLPVSARDARETGLIPGSGRPLYSYMENYIDREAWQATIHGVTKSQILLSN